MFYQLTLPGGIELEYPKGFKFQGKDPGTGQEMGTIGAVVSEILKYLYPFAGLILFFMLIWGGFSFLTAAGDEEKIKSGQQRITWAVVGFLVLFVAFWLMRLLQFVLGIGMV